MFNQAIQDILTRKLQSPPAMVMEKTLARDIDELVAHYLPAARVAVVDDENTATAYGDHVARALKNSIHITLPYGVLPDEAALATIDARSKSADVLVAVGSGTVNDLVKFASHKAGKPYIIIPTAASMNGYVSRNASIITGGKKESSQAHLPLAVLMDMSVIAAAPPRLAAAGIGDSLARPTAQADWLLSHHYAGTAYDGEIYELIKPYEPQVFAHADGAARGDSETLAALMKLLLASGFGMTIAESSAPASGAEHMIAHMLSRKENLHGEEIAITAVDVAAIQERIKVEDAVREAISAIHIAPAALAAIRTKAGLPERPEQLGWSEEAYAHAIANARHTRDRFTCLNLN